jgi:hypothetical protein
VIQGFSSQYIIINEISLVDIICSKNWVSPGSLYALVNTNHVTTPFVCKFYSNGNCQSQLFKYDLTSLNDSANYYQFDCGMTGNSNILATSLILQRLCKSFFYSFIPFYTF